MPDAALKTTAWEAINDVEFPDHEKESVHAYTRDPSSQLSWTYDKNTRFPISIASSKPKIFLYVFIYAW